MMNAWRRRAGMVALGLYPVLLRRGRAFVPVRLLERLGESANGNVVVRAD